MFSGHYIQQNIAGHKAFAIQLHCGVLVSNKPKGEAKYLIFALPIELLLCDQKLFCAEKALLSDCCASSGIIIVRLCIILLVPDPSLCNKGGSCNDTLN